MKDLKHLIYFENLLQEANNELVQQAKAEGEHALGYTCYFVPETLLNLPGCFSSRLRAPNTGSIDVGTYYMSSKICSYTRSILERGIEGGYDYLDALLSSETCQMMHRGHEHFEILGLVKEKNPQFFMSMMDVPFSDEDFAVDHYEEQLRVHVLEPLHETYGIDISDKAIRAAIRDHNEISRVMTEIGDLRKAANPVITGYEFHVLTLATYVAPKYLLIDKLEETLKELKDSIKREITEQREQSAKYAVENELMEKVAANIECDIPDALIDEQCARFLEEFKQRLQSQGIPYDQYCKMTNMDEAKFLEEGKEPATRQVRMDLAVNAIIKEEKLEATDEEVEKQYNDLAEKYSMDVNELKKYLDAMSVRTQIIRDKAISVVVDSAKIEKKKAPKKEAEGEAAEGEEKPAKKTAAKKSAKKEEEKAE